MLLGVALLVLVALVVVGVATFTRRPRSVSIVAVAAVTALIVQAGAHDAQLTLGVVLLVGLGALAAKAVGDLAGALRPRREPPLRTREEREREAAARMRRRSRLAA